MNIEYNPNIPIALLPLIKERFESLSHLFPEWCHTLTISYDSTQIENAELQCVCEYKYRFVQIILYEPFFETKEWINSVLHEIQHAIVGPYRDEVDKIIDLLTEDIATKSYLKSRIHEAEEALATDMAIFIEKIYLDNRESLVV